MTYCEACQGAGLVPWVSKDNPKPNADISVKDMHYAVCLCEVGRTFRVATNNGRKVAPLWRVWCAREQVDPSRVFMLEDVYSAEELAAWGFQKATPLQVDREAALQAAGKKVKR